MPRHGVTGEFSKEQQGAVERARRALMAVVDSSTGTCAFEEQMSALLAEVGRQGVQKHLEGLTEHNEFKENEVVWRVANRGEKKLMTLFGWVTVRRPLFRSTRNGPTRCLISERAGLFQGKWTGRAARAAARVTAELPFERSEALLRELGHMAPSKTLLQRLDRHLLDLWELDRERHEQRLRDDSTIPRSAVVAVISLDGVMVNMVGSDRAATVARAMKAGRSTRGPSGYKEAAVGVVTLHDAQGARLATWRMGRMPEDSKASVKAWIRGELAWLRRKRPGIRLVAAADGAQHNWTFLKTLDPDVEVVDYFHVMEYVSRHLSEANGPNTLATQKKLLKVKRLLLEVEGGARKAFAMIDAARRAAGQPVTDEKCAPTRVCPTRARRRRVPPPSLPPPWWSELRSVVVTGRRGEESRSATASQAARRPRRRPTPGDRAPACAGPSPASQADAG
jgi:hypothetical protein